MKNMIFLDTGVISLLHTKHEETLKEIKTKKKNSYSFISSELNYIELFNHLCRSKGKINAQIIMENIRNANTIDFIPVEKNVSLLAGELKCKYNFLSMVDSVIVAEALSKKIPLYTTETHFSDIDKLKAKKIKY